MNSDYDAAMRVDEVIALVDLGHRTGATNLELGWVRDDVPVDQAGWWAHAQYRGGRIFVEHQASPGAAAAALADRLLTGGRCRCGKVCTTSPFGAMVFPGGPMPEPRPGARNHISLEPWSAETAEAAGSCLWTREGRRWVSECGAGR